MRIALIAAVAVKSRIIGLNGGIPWNLPTDMAHFRKKTQGQIVVMGSKTWNSIPEKYRPLKDRINIVISRTMPSLDGVHVVHSIDQAILQAYKVQPRIGNELDLMVIGGGSIYTAFLPLADKLYVTYVPYVGPGDAYFPNVDLEQWRQDNLITFSQLEKHTHPFSIVTYSRK